MPRSVLITGSSTGIGRAAALHMDALGWVVYAGVRKESDGLELSDAASTRLHPVIIDVADQASITAAAKNVAEQTGGRLDGLVNNAGITVQGPLEYLPLDDLRKQLEVNVVGQVAVTQAFLPQLREATGRVVFVGSVAGRAFTLPFIGPYGASKKAIGAIGEALRMELKPWNIKVSVLEPGSVATPIWEKGDASFDEELAALPDEAQQRYGRVLDKARKIAAATGRRGIPAEKVAAKVEHALTSKRPRLHYLIGADAFAQTYLLSPSPTSMKERAIGKLLGFGR